MRTSAASSSASGSGRLKAELTRIVRQVHKTASDHGIGSDSGVSFSGEASSSQPPRQGTGSSVASTITPESAPDRASTVTAPSNILPTLSTGLPLLPQLGADDSDVVASPAQLNSNEAFFPATSSPRSSLSLSPSSSQDFELNDLWDGLARQLKPIADVLRTGRHRNDLGTSRLPADCVSALQLWLSTDTATSKPQPNTHVIEAAIEIFRVLANLCIDHDANRTVLAGISAAPTVLAAVSTILRKQDQSRSTALFSVQILTFLRAAMGAVLNMQLEHVATRQSLATVDCIHTLASVASCPRIYLPHIWAMPRTVEIENDAGAAGKLKMGATVTSWAWRVVQEIFDDAKEEKDGHLGTPSDEMDDGDLDDASLRDVRSILSRRCFHELLRPLSLYVSADGHAAGHRIEMDADDIEDLVDADAEILQTVTTLIESCAAEEADFRQRAVLPFQATQAESRHHQLEDGFQCGLDVLMSFVEKAEVPPEWVRDFSALDGSIETDSDANEDAQAAEEMRKTFAQAKASIARGVVAVSGDDNNMVNLFSGSHNFIDRLKAWTRYDPQTRDDLVSCGMLALGNLARSDAHCLSLVREHGLAPILASLLAQADDIKVVHGLVSLLKNLSIPAPNKAVIGQLDVIAAVTRFMNKDKDMVQPLQFATVGLLKHLCAGVTENAVRLVDGSSASSALNALVDMIRRIDDVPTKMEATRVLVNVIKSLWTSARSDASGTKALPDQIILAARQKMVRRDVIQAVAEMVRTSPKYPVLVNEGIIALTLVGSERTGAELVSLSLLAEPNKASTEHDDDEEMGSDNETEGRVARRRSTVDSSASTSSHPLPPPDCAIDMVNLVLARRDARMPPQFACNACALVLSLCHATRGASSTGAVGQEAVARVAATTRPALQQLKDHGPTEALAAAADALQAVSQAA